MGTIPEKIVILRGAGISQDSGLDTFRGEVGAWNKVPASEVMPDGGARLPGTVST